MVILPVQARRLPCGFLQFIQDRYKSLMAV